MTESKPGEVRLTLEATERARWLSEHDAFLATRRGSLADDLGDRADAWADGRVLAYRKRCAPEPSDAPDEDPCEWGHGGSDDRNPCDRAGDWHVSGRVFCDEHAARAAISELDSDAWSRVQADAAEGGYNRAPTPSSEPGYLIDPCDLTGEGGGRYATYEEAERFALALVTDDARKLVDRLRELESDEALGIIERRQLPTTPEPDGGDESKTRASDEASWLCAEAYGADRECLECQRVVRGCIALDGESELLVCVKHYDGDWSNMAASVREAGGGSPRVDVEALQAILRDEEAAADPDKTSGPRRAEAWDRARRLRAALGRTEPEATRVDHPANVVNPEKREVEIKTTGPGQSGGAPTWPGWWWGTLQGVWHERPWLVSNIGGELCFEWPEGEDRPAWLSESGSALVARMAKWGGPCIQGSADTTARRLAATVAALVTGDDDSAWDGPQVVEFALVSAKDEIGSLRAKLDALTGAVRDEAGLLRDWAEVINGDGESATSLALIAIADRLEDAAKDDAPTSPRVELPAGDGNDARARATGWPVHNGVMAGPCLEDLSPTATSSPTTPDPRPRASAELEAKVAAAIKQERG